MTDQPQAAKVQRRRGARSKCTPARAKLICEAIALGVPVTRAVKLAKLSFTTYSKWLQRDAKLREELELAEAKSIESLLKTMHEFAPKDWRCCLALLQVKAPLEFGKQRVEHQHVHIAGADRVLIYLPQKSDEIKALPNNA